MVMFMGSSLLSMLAVLITAKQWIAAVEALGTPSINPSARRYRTGAHLLLLDLLGPAARCRSCQHVRRGALAQRGHRVDRHRVLLDVPFLRYSLCGREQEMHVRRVGPRLTSQSSGPACGGPLILVVRRRGSSAVRRRTIPCGLARRALPSFPRSPWECRPRRSASSGRGREEGSGEGRRASQTAFPRGPWERDPSHRSGHHTSRTGSPAECRHSPRKTTVGLHRSGP